MPKDVSERIIDSPFAPPTRGGSVSTGGGGGGGGGATSLDAPTDVTLSGVSNGQTLAYNSGSGQWVNSAPAAMTAHALSGAFHTGQLNWSLINFGTDSNLADLFTRQHVDLQGMTPNDHHNQVHVLATGTALGADHTISGAAAGEVLRALTATTAAFDVLHHTDLDNILPDQHHPWVHDIITGAPTFGVAHTVTGADYTVVGVHPANTLAILPTSNAPGAAISVLRTDANGGIQLDTNLLYVDGANNRVGINKVPTDAGFGSAALDIIASNNADHTQRIRQKAGQTGRLWRVENTAFHELIVMDSDGSLMSGNPLFTSGLAGWNITPEGNAEFNNIWARGELHATVFVKDEVHATGGTFMVASAGVLHDDAQIDSTTVDDDVLLVYSTPAGMGVPLQVVTTSGTFVGNELHVIGIRNLLNINDPPSGPAFYFQPGDIIRVKTEIAKPVPPDTLRLADLWLEVNGAVQNDGYASYSVTWRSGSNCTIPKGTALVSYGKEGDGRILMTSDLQFAPYIDVFTTGTNVWTGAAGAVKERMRMGRLDGIKVPGIQGIEQYGMIAGKDLTDANQGYFIASNLQFSLYKINIRLNDGSNDTGLWTADGTLRIGKNVSADATTGFRFDAATGDVIIGNPSLATPNYMRWNQNAGTLVVSGTLLVTDPGGTVTLGQVNVLDDQVRTDAGLSATGYAGQARDISIAYSDARRIIGVNGSWFSPGTNRVSWGTKGTATLTGGTALSVVFATPVGSTRTIADPPSPFYITIAARTYLYVSMSGTGTMTMLSTTSIATVSAANNVLIAVCDPGDPAVPSAARLASITVVAGSTYVSGGNIFTGSITAGNIAAGTITADKLIAGSITSTYLDPTYTSGVNSDISTAQTTANTANSAAGNAQTTANTANTAAGTAQSTANSANTAAGTAQTTANSAQTAAAAAQADADAAATAAANNLTYSENRRVVGVTGTWTVVDGDTITWASLQVKFANLTARTITAQSGHVLTPLGRHYLYIDVTDATPAMLDTQTLSSLGVNNALIAVVDTGALKASISVVAGSTYISGGNIMTGSIVTTNIAAATISADRMNIDYLDGMSSGVVKTGILEVDGSSNIHTAGKINFANTTNGFFLGYDGSAYKFKVGNVNTQLSWDGTNLSMNTNQFFNISNTNTGQIFSITGPGGATGLLTLTSAGVLTSSGTLSAPLVTATKVINSGTTFQIATPRAVPSNNSVGIAGEMAWEYDGTGALWLYFCYTANFWRRIQFPTTAW